MISPRRNHSRRTSRRTALPLLLLCSVLALAACGSGPDSGSDTGTGSGNQPTESTAPSASGTPSGSASATGTPGPTASPSAPASPDSAATTSLTVEFLADGQTTTDTWTLQCEGATALPGATVPDPAAACAVLAEQDTALFAEADRNAMCTQNIIGMQRAHVTGTVNGEAVDTVFSLTDGCQISRWEPLAGLLGPAEGTL